MRAKPPEVDEAELQSVIEAGWLFDAESLAFEPVGAGSHHWVATDRHGSRRFVTVDDLGLKPWLGADAETTFSGLKKDYEVAARLRDHGLDFVVAPLPTSRGEVVVRLGERFTVALFPFIVGSAGDFDEMLEGAERDAMLRMWARLHSATAAVRHHASARGFGIPLRGELERAMHETDRDWSAGPLSRHARDWLALNREYVIRALKAFDRAVEEVARSGRELVITHGEPHGLNVMRSRGALHLIDWDTVALALPERDLWMLDDGTEDPFQPYVDVAGRPVDRDALAVYGMAWHLTDLALFVGLLRSSHADDADSRAALLNLDVAASRLADYIPR